MSRMVVPRLLAAGTAVTAATAFRVGAGCATLVARRVPRLLRLAVGSMSDPADARADSELRDELVALFRDSAETSWLELRRGVADLDAFTRPGSGLRDPRRPHRVKP